jgi:PAS domain S-box-containing protein
MLKSDLPAKSGAKLGEFKGSLERTVLVGLLLLALIPTFIMGAINYFRTRQTITDQVSTQLKNVVTNEGELLDKMATNSQATMNDLINNDQMLKGIRQFLDAPEELGNKNWVDYLFSNYLSIYRPSNGIPYSQLFLVSNDGIVLSSTLPSWVGQNLNQANPEMVKFIGQENTFPVYNTVQLYPNELVMFSSKFVYAENGNTVRASLIGAFSSTIYKSALHDQKVFFPSGNAFYLFDNGRLLSIDDAGQTFFFFPPNATHEAEVKNMLSSLGEYTTVGLINSHTNLPVFAYGQKVANQNFAIVVEASQSYYFQSLNDQLPLDIIMILMTGLVIGGLIAAASRQLVIPLRQLAKNAQSFAKGDWSERTTLTRNDEIGLLAFSFNAMAEQLSELYRSLEQKVEDRTKQLRTATEVTQFAITPENRDEIFEKVVNLAVERFNYSASNIFLLDDTGNYLVMHGSAGKEQKHAKGYRIPVGANTLMSWVANNNHYRVIGDLNEESFYKIDLILADTLSEAALPISVGQQVLGVLEVQSAKTDDFDQEIIDSLQTMANQLASGLQNVRLLESTQINLEETTLLYRTSRQITQAKDEKEVIDLLTTTIRQTSYVSGIFEVEEDHLRILALNDPKSPAGVSSAHGITLPIQKVANRLKQESLILIDNLVQAPDFSNILSFFVRSGCRSAALISVNKSGELSKVVVLGSRETTAITGTALQPFGNLIEVVNSTLERLQIMVALQHRLSDLQTLTNVSQAISVETDVYRLYEVLHQQVTGSMGSDVGFIIAHYNPGTNQIEIPYLYEGNEVTSLDPFPMGEGLTSYIIQNRTPLLLVKDAEQKIEDMGLKVIGKLAKSWLGVPLIVGDVVIGAMILQDSEREERFTESDLNLLTTLSPQIAIAIRNAQLLTEIQSTLKAYDQERFLLNTLLDNSPDEIYFKDSDGNYLRVSKSYSTRFGMENPENLIGKSDLELMGDESGLQTYKEEQDLIISGEVQLKNIKKEISKEGNDLWYLHSKLPIFEKDGQTVGIFGIIRDITDMKKTEILVEQRAQELLTASEIARDTTGTLEVDELLTKAVNLIRDRFGFYHSSIFLMDALGEYAILRDSTGEVGRSMKEAGHKLAAGSRSIVGQTAGKAEPMVVNDVTQDPIYYPNPRLPDTRSELAIPLKVGNRVLGILDVQSDKVNAFLPEDVSIIQILADQLAVAVSNANLFARTQENLAQHRLLHQITTAATACSTLEDALLTTVEGLKMALAGDRVSILMPLDKTRLSVRSSSGYDEGTLSETDFLVGEGSIGLAAAEKHPILIKDTFTDPRAKAVDEAIRSQLSVPILFRDTLLGVLNVESTEVAAYDENDQEILGALGISLGAIISNARLLEEIRKQVDRQQMLYDITSKIRRSADVKTIMQTSASEISKILGARRARIEITTELSPQPSRQQTKRRKNNGKEAGL